jgi:hypothetical protein
MIIAMAFGAYSLIQRDNAKTSTAGQQVMIEKISNLASLTQDIKSCLSDTSKNLAELQIWRAKVDTRFMQLDTLIDKIERCCSK